MGQGIIDGQYPSEVRSSPEIATYPRDTTLFMEFPKEWNAGSSEQRLQAMIMMLESPICNQQGQILREFLLEKDISLSVSIPQDGDPHSFEIMRYLSDHGIPFCAWVGIRDTQGYYLNHQTAARYMERALQIATWAEHNEVALGGVGLDIEPSIDMMKQFSTGQMGVFARSLVEYRRWILRQYRKQGEEQRIDDTAARLREKYGLYVEAYTAPWIIHKFLGLPTPKELDGRVEMLYSSMYGVSGPLFRLLWKKDAHPAFGIVNGIPEQTPGRDFEGLMGMSPERRAKKLATMHLTDEQLARDVRIANAVSMRRFDHPLSHIYVFGINGAEVAVRVQNIRKQVLG